MVSVTSLIKSKSDSPPPPRLGRVKFFSGKNIPVNVYTSDIYVTPNDLFFKFLPYFNFFFSTCASRKVGTTFDWNA
jgi:hypothetical protein